MRMYITFRSCAARGAIKPVTVLSETAGHLVVPGKGKESCQKRQPEIERFHATWIAAKEHLVADAERQVMEAHVRLQAAQSHLSAMKLLKPSSKIAKGVRRRASIETTADSEQAPWHAQVRDALRPAVKQEAAREAC